MNGVGSDYDIIDEMEGMIDNKLDNMGIDSGGINEYKVRDKNKAKTRLGTLYNNRHPETDSDQYTAYQRNVRLPERYFKETEEFDWNYTQTIKDAVISHAQSPYRTRSHRIDIKKEIIAYIEDDEDEFENDITSELVNEFVKGNDDIRVQEVEYVSVETEEPEPEDTVDIVVGDDINSLDDFKKDGDKVYTDNKGLDELFNAIDNVIDSDPVTASDIKDAMYTFEKNPRDDEKSDTYSQDYMDDRFNKYLNSRDIESVSKAQIELNDSDIDLLTKKVEGKVTSTYGKSSPKIPIKSIEDYMINLLKVITEDNVDIYVEYIVKNSSKINYGTNSLGKEFLKSRHFNIEE
jgi:hypothetical protein